MDLRAFEPANILVCQLRRIGDVVLMTPVPELLAQRYPHARIHVLTEKTCAPVLENNPHITQVWPLDKKRLSNLLREIAYYRKVARTGFDLVVDMQQMPRCRWVVAFSRAPVRLTRTPPWYTRWLYTHWSDPPRGYAAGMKAAVLAPLGIAWNGEAPRIFLRRQEEEQAAAYLAGLGLLPEHTLLTVDPTHTHATRRWPAAYYARLLDLAAERNPALRFLLLYGPGEEQVARGIAAAAAHHDRLLVPDSVIGLREAAACIARAAMHVGHCSAPRHIAVAVGTPSFTLLGATGTGWTYPSDRHAHMALELPCQPCNKNSCDTGARCLAELTPEAVLPRLLAHLDSHGNMAVGCGGRP